MWRPVLALAALLGACQTTQPVSRQDIDFVRGCWVSKQPLGLDATIFLRLLPQRIYPAIYEGQLTVIANGEPQSGHGLVSFARDGSRATFYLDDDRTLGGDYVRVPEPEIWPAPRLSWRVAYADKKQRSGPEAAYFVVDGDEQRLSLSVADGGGSILPVFEFERDGCD